MIKVGENISEIPKLNCEKTKCNIGDFIKSKVSESKSKGIVIGLSGGIDSTLAAYLACEAVGKENVFGVSMPSTTTPTEDKIHAIEIAQELGIKYKEIAIDSVLNEYLSVTQLDNYNLAIGNLKARIRMSILYYFARYCRLILGYDARERLEHPRGLFKPARRLRGNDRLRLRAR